MIVGIAIDSWKLPIFKKHLDKAGYAYTEHSGVTADTKMLKVITSHAKNLVPIVNDAQRECKAQ